MGFDGNNTKRCFLSKPVKTAWINQRKIVSSNILQTLELFESNIDSTYAVAWIDCYAKGSDLGRSVLMLGEHAEIDELNNCDKLKPLKTRKKKNFLSQFFSQHMF